MFILSAGLLLFFVSFACFYLFVEFVQSEGGDSFLFGGVYGNNLQKTSLIIAVDDDQLPNICCFFQHVI